MTVLFGIRSLWRKASQLYSGEDSIVADYFDNKYYLTMYADVASANADPLAHFLNHGWREGRNPNAWFVTEFYLAQNPDVRTAGVNPFVHYLRHGRHEGRVIAPPLLDRPVPLTALVAERSRHEKRPQSEVSIVVPIYNAFDDLEAILDNLDKTVGDSARVILVDDCSPDERVGPCIDEWARRRKTWMTVRNEHNVGFAASVNRGIEHSTGHVVILNSDVLLPQNWLDILLAPIWQDHESVASVTPFSNNSSLTGFPALRQEAELPTEVTLEDIANAFACLPSLAIDIASGIGFCMAINRRALDQIGLFDADAYCSGYFEDTDWCQRAVLAGFRNVAVSNLFVHHRVGSSSYGIELRNRYSERNRVEFLRRFPFYGKCEQAFLRNDPLMETRMLAQAMLWRRSAQVAVLVVDHSWGGGANIFSDRLRRRMVTEGTFVVTLSLMQAIVEVKFAFQSEELRCQELFSRDIWRLAEFFDCDEVIVNGVHGASRVPEVLSDLVRISRGRKLTFFIHDYMSVCPSIFLLDGKGHYCGVPDIRVCYECLGSNAHAKFGVINQTEWRRAWGAFLKNAQEVRVFSESSRDILLQAYPMLAHTSQIQLMEAGYEPECGGIGRPAAASQSMGRWGRQRRRRLRVGIMGSMYFHKGARVVAELARYIEVQGLPVEIVLFGQWHEGQAPKNIEQLGAYRVAEVGTLVRQKNISVMLFPSVCPETYSYTLSEMFRMELPIVALRLGAQAERVGNYKWGVLVDDRSPQSLCDALWRAESLGPSSVADVRHQ